MTEPELVEGSLAGWRSCSKCRNLVEPWHGWNRPVSGEPYMVTGIHVQCLGRTINWIRWRKNVQQLRKQSGLPPLPELE